MFLHARNSSLFYKLLMIIYVHVHVIVQIDINETVAEALKKLLP